MGVDQHLGQGRHIPQSHIKALPGDRVHAVIGVSDQGQTPANSGFRLLQRQRIGPTAAGKIDCAQKVAEPAAQFGQKFRLIQGHNGRRQVFPFRPNDRRAVAPER